MIENLKSGEAVVIIDYKMKLELGMHAREIQREWYGKRGILIHGFYVIAQVSANQKKIEVLDLWSNDTSKMLGSPKVPWTLGSDGWKKHFRASVCIYSPVSEHPFRKNWIIMK